MKQNHIKQKIFLGWIFCCVFWIHSASAQVAKLANANLYKCINTKAYGPLEKIPLTDFDCVPTAVDSEGNLTNKADKNYKNWNDVLIGGKSNTPLTGFYRKNGQRCEGLTSATVDCPMALRAKFVMTCNENDLRFYHQTLKRCTVANKVKIYRALYQEVATPTDMPMKAVVIADKNVTGNSVTAQTFPMSAISSAAKLKYDCKDFQKPGDAPLFQMGTDEYGLPLCKTDQTVEAMQKTMCEEMMNRIWKEGGTSTTPCQIITVKKIFKLMNSTKTTADCLYAPKNSAPKILYQVLPSGEKIKMNDFIPLKLELTESNIPGGTLSGDMTDETSFKAKYKITVPSAQFICKEKTETLVTITQDKNLDWRSETTTSFTVPDNLSPSLGIYVTVVGGGGGGGGTQFRFIEKSHGGAGGNAGEGKISANLTNIKPGSTCTIKVGKGGSGGSDDSIDYENNSGKPSSVTCTLISGGNNSITAAGGTAVGNRGGDWHSGEDGKPSPYTKNGGGAGGGCGMGSAGTQPGAGGGGGGCKDSCGGRSGGGGAPGMVKVEQWGVFEEVDWK